MMNRILKKLQKYYYMYVKRDPVTYARKLGVRIGDNCQILADPQISFGTEPWLISLGNHVDVTAGVEFLCHEGGMWCARGIDEQYEPIDCFAPIKVGNNVMIGIDSLIMPGVNIGNNVIIGGHSIVTKDVPDGAVVAGMPAKQISTVEKFMDNLQNKNLVETKYMTQEEKRLFLMKKYPQWF